jgi:hypothetical protein
MLALRNRDAGSASDVLADSFQAPSRDFPYSVTYGMQLYSGADPFRSGADSFLAASSFGGRLDHA